MRCPHPPRHVVPLLRTLRSPSRALSLPDDEWDRVLRMARRARLHGVLAHRLAALEERLPAAVASQLAAARAEASFAAAMVLNELAEVRRALASLDVELIVLKGGAYLAQGLECAHGRLPADLDVMVRAVDFDRVESTLVAAGWKRPSLGRYDTHYYRRWVHQAPPLRAVGHAVELDLHHAILPPRGRRRVITQRLWDASVPAGTFGIEGAALRVLSREDQVVHAAAHLFIDSDCTNQLHGLFDIAALIDEFARADTHFMAALNARAKQLGLADALHHAMAFITDWLQPPPVTHCSVPLPARAARALIARRLCPPDPDAMPPNADAVHAVLLARSLWFRLPPHLALVHALSRPLRRLRPE